jgi:hypothetical protein
MARRSASRETLWRWDQTRADRRPRRAWPTFSGSSRSRARSSETSKSRIAIRVSPRHARSETARARTGHVRDVGLTTGGSDNPRRRPSRALRAQPRGRPLDAASDRDALAASAAPRPASSSARRVSDGSRPSSTRRSTPSSAPATPSRAATRRSSRRSGCSSRATSTTGRRTHRPRPRGRTLPGRPEARRPA